MYFIPHFWDILYTGRKQNTFEQVIHKIHTESVLKTSLLLNNKSLDLKWCTELFLINILKDLTSWTMNFIFTSFVIPLILEIASIVS